MSVAAATRPSREAGSSARRPPPAVLCQATRRLLLTSLDDPVRRADAHPLDPGEGPVHRLLQQLPADGQLPGHRPGHPAGPARVPAGRCSRSRCCCWRRRRRDPASSSNVQVQGGRTRSSSGSRTSSEPRTPTSVLLLAVVAGHGGDGGAGDAARPAAQDRMPPLKAYAIDIVGSMTGHRRLHASCRRSGTSPVVWFSVAAVLVVLLVLGTRIDCVGRRHRRLRSSARPVAASSARSRPDDIWSPYYRISILQPRRVTGALQAINVNGIPHQALHSVGVRARSRSTSRSTVVPGPDVRERAHRRRRQRLGRRARARRNEGAIQHIDAVEIDPALQADRHGATTPTGRTTIPRVTRTSTTAGRSCAPRTRSTTSSSSPCPTR